MPVLAMWVHARATPVRAADLPHAATGPGVLAGRRAAVRIPPVRTPAVRRG